MREWCVKGGKTSQRGIYYLAANRLGEVVMEHEITLVIGGTVCSDLDKKFFELREVQNAIDANGEIAIYVILKKVELEEVD